MKKILVVDDHADIRKLVRMTLEFEDCEVHEAFDAHSALEAAAVLRPDIVLLDVMMPGDLDGLDVCRRLKANTELAGIHVLLLSARGHARDREAGMQAGADAYMVKPFSPLQLIGHISNSWATA